MKTTPTIAKVPFGKIPQSVADSIDSTERTNALSTANFRFQASARSLTATYEAEMHKLREAYLKEAASINGAGDEAFE